ncbi:MAG: hypothetical protein HUJ60_03740, partial [Bacilli bacterium]|nr:hypothetical protein [Bacilli bacterium]
MDAKKLILTNRQKRTRFQILTAAAVFTVLALAAIALIVWGLLADYITTLVGILVIVFGVSSALLVFISVRLAEKQNRLRLIAINSLEHFPTMHFVYTESYFNAEVDRFLRRKAGKNPGYMVSFDAKNLYSTVLAAYGEDVTKEIVEVMYQCVHKQLNNRAGVFFGYDANDGFFLYFHGFTREQVINEIQALADASENALKSRPSLPIVTLLFGVYPMQFGEPSDYCIDRAVYAQRYDIASRTDSTPVFFRDQMKENAQVESYLAKEINSVLDEGQLEIYY